MVTPNTSSARSRRVWRNLTLALALFLVLGAGAWVFWFVQERENGREIMDDVPPPGATDSPGPSPEPVDLQPIANQLDHPVAVGGEEDREITNELLPLLFETAPVVIVTAEERDVPEGPEDPAEPAGPEEPAESAEPEEPAESAEREQPEVPSEVAQASKVLSAPVLLADDTSDFTEIFTELNTQAVLFLGAEVVADADIAQIELSVDWHEDLRTELGPIVEPQPVTEPTNAVLFQAGDAKYPYAELTARAAGFATDYLSGESLLAAAPDLSEVTELVLVSSEPPDTEILTWQYAVLKQENELPGGGYELFPDKRYVALYGSPDVPALGILGQQNLADTLTLAQDYADDYQELTRDLVVPTFEIIATVATAGAGADGQYSNRLPEERLRPWVEAAGEAGYYVLLDLQPGRTDFLTQAQEYAELLALPHVGLALDPEWRLKPGQKHLTQIGSVGAKEINDVSEWLAQFTREKELPPKMLILHQFSLSMIKNRSDINTEYPEVSIVIHADGQGTQGAKNGTWNTLHQNAPDVAGWGWKNFLEEDHPVLSPEDTYKVDPLPQLVTYQ